MSRQDKATTDRNARTLRELVKQPDNKACADCRKNDARWASWNLGVYLCIRCSGIHRSMGTHISRVKSIDLDIWTPEQMENIQKWGNRRANLYWERHLKAGHVPPEHKIESFIRSKYESRRWAMEGPLPEDPASLENGASVQAPPQPDHSSRPTPTSSAPAPQPAGRAAHPLLSRQTASKPAAPTPAVAPPIIDIFSDDPPPPAAQPTAAPSGNPPPAAPAATAAAAAPPGPTQTQNNHIFDLDFRPPSAPAGGAGTGRQSNKQDIMSLFSSPSSGLTSPTGTGGFGGSSNGAGQGFFGSAATGQQTQGQVQQPGGYGGWGGGITSSASPTQQHATQSPVGGAGGSQGWGGMGFEQNAWGAPTQTAQPPQPTQQRQASFGSSGNAWGSSGGSGGGSGALGGLGSLGGDPWVSSNNTQAQPQAKVQQQKKDDPFANIWE